MTDNRASDSLLRGIETAKAGNKLLARLHLLQAVELAPRDPNCWLWLAWVSESPASAIHSLEKVLDEDPDNVLAQIGMRWATGMAEYEYIDYGPRPPQPEAPAPAEETAEAPAAVQEQSEPAEAPREERAEIREQHKPEQPEPQQPEPEQAEAAIEASAEESVELSAEPMAEPEVGFEQASDAIDDDEDFGSEEESLQTDSWDAIETPTFLSEVQDQAETLSEETAEESTSNWFDNEPAETETQQEQPAAQEPFAESPAEEPAGFEQEPETIEFAEADSEDEAETNASEETLAEPAWQQTASPAVPVAEPEPEPVAEVESEPVAEETQPSWIEPETSSEPVSEPKFEAPVLSAEAEETMIEVAEAQEEPAASEEKIFDPTADDGEHGVSVLVVDDSPTVRKLVTMTLEKNGFTVGSAPDGVVALKSIAELKPRLILLDITMPRLGGYQLCKLIKKHESTRHIPVIMLSGKDGMFDKVRGKFVGCDDYITKPFDPDVLVEKITTQLTEHYGVAAAR